jgi:glutamate-1-semialdehyde aminotransferase
MKQQTSTDPNDYEILIRRRDENDYASYCPQLGHMIKGVAHEEVEEAMKQFILDHISALGQPTGGD